MSRRLEHWPEYSAYPTRLSELDGDADRAMFYRERNSHRGISKFSTLRKLQAKCVNQEFLNEICEMAELEYLSLDLVTADDLAPLARLGKLRTLHIEGVRKAKEFDVLTNLPRLRDLYICNAKHLRSIEFLRDAHHLELLGIEGATWTTQTVESLQPLSGLTGLQSLFMTSARLIDKDLTVLADCPNLMELQCARFAPKRNFKTLRVLMPSLECHWCEKYEIDEIN